MPTSPAIDDGKIPFKAEFHNSYKKYIADLILEKAKSSDMVVGAELREYNYLTKLGAVGFHMGRVETAYFFIDLDRTGYIKMSNIRFESGRGSFPDQGHEYFNKKLTVDKLFDIIRSGYLVHNSSADVKFDIQILKNPLDFIKISDGALQNFKHLLAEIFKTNFFEWRCLICGSQIEKLSNLQQLYYYLNGFAKKKYQRCTGKKHRHMNWYSIDHENGTMTFYGRFNDLEETVELKLDIKGLASEDNKYLIAKRASI